MRPSLRFYILRRDGFICRYCGRRPPRAVLHVDHVVPVSRGGTNHERNLVTACSLCNLGKSTAPAEDPHTIELGLTELAKFEKTLALHGVDDMAICGVLSETFTDRSKAMRLVSATRHVFGSDDYDINWGSE